MDKNHKEIFSNLFEIETPNTELLSNIGKMIMIKRKGENAEKYGIKINNILVQQAADYDTKKEKIIWKGIPSLFIIMEIQKNYKGEQIYRCYEIDGDTFGKPVSPDEVVFIKNVIKS